MTYEYDAELRRMVGDVVLQLSHYVVEGEAGLEYTVMDVQFVVGAQVEKPDAKWQHLLHGLAWGFSGNSCTDGTKSRERA